MEQSASYLHWCNERARQRARRSLRHQVGGHWTARVGGGPPGRAALPIALASFHKRRIDTMSNGSISPDLGDMWHHGYLVSPQWEEGLELDSASDCDNASVEVGIAAAQAQAMESGPKDYISVVRDSSRSPYISYFDEVHPPRSTWDLPETIEGVSVPFENVPLMSSTAIEETLQGTFWSLISPCRTVARRWNVGSRDGELGDIFFEFLENDPFVRQWYRNVEGNKV